MPIKRAVNNLKGAVKGKFGLQSHIVNVTGNDGRLATCIPNNSPFRCFLVKVTQKHRTILKG